jgi:hypothetical protein
MATFVLILFLTGKGVTTIPGYDSEDACEAAGRSAFKQAGPGAKFGDPMVLGHICVPGPKANPVG